MRGILNPLPSGDGELMLFRTYLESQNTGSGGSRTYTMDLGNGETGYAMFDVSCFDNSAGTSTCDSVTVTPDGGSAVSCRKLIFTNYHINSRSEISIWVTETPITLDANASVVINFNSTQGQAQCSAYSVTGAEDIYMYAAAQGNGSDPSALAIDLIKRGIGHGLGTGTSGGLATWTGLAEDYEGGTPNDTGASEQVAVDDDARAVSLDWAVATGYRALNAVCLAPLPLNSPMKFSASKAQSATHSISRAFGAAGDRTEWTIALWFRTSTTTTMTLAACYTGSNEVQNMIIGTNGGRISLSGWSQQFADTNIATYDDTEWHHLIVSFDTSQATAGDRVKIYVDGVDDTRIQSSPSLNSQRGFMQGAAHYFGRRAHDAVFPFSGEMTDIIIVDGNSIQAGDFAVSDFVANSGGVLVPQAFDGPFGTQGSRLDMTDEAALGNDVSGNNNDFTLNGTVDPSIRLPRMAA